jgi:hypothetical protein
MGAAPCQHSSAPVLIEAFCYQMAEQPFAVSMTTTPIQSKPFSLLPVLLWLSRCKLDALPALQQPSLPAAIMGRLQHSSLADFERHHIDLSLRRVMLSLLQVTTPTSMPIPLDNLDDDYLALLQAQALIGPNSIFFGLFVNGWLPLQDRYLFAINLPRDKHQAASGCWNVK